MIIRKRDFGIVFEARTGQAALAPARDGMNNEQEQESLTGLTHGPIRFVRA